MVNLSSIAAHRQELLWRYPLSPSFVEHSLQKISSHKQEVFYSSTLSVIFSSLIHKSCWFVNLDCSYMKIKIWGAIAHYKKLCCFTICCCFKVQLGIVTAMIPWIHNTFLWVDSVASCLLSKIYPSFALGDKWSSFKFNPFITSTYNFHCRNHKQLSEPSPLEGHPS